LREEDKRQTKNRGRCRQKRRGVKLEWVGGQDGFHVPSFLAWAILVTRFGDPLANTSLHANFPRSEFLARGAWISVPLRWGSALFFRYQFWAFVIFWASDVINWRRVGRLAFGATTRGKESLAGGPSNLGETPRAQWLTHSIVTRGPVIQIVSPLPKCSQHGQHSPLPSTSNPEAN
jgi:hypothetical protein